MSIRSIACGLLLTVAACGDDSAALPAFTPPEAGAPPAVADAGADTGADAPSSVVATPSFDPAPGTFGTNLTGVTLASATPGAAIFYTIDGTNPHAGSRVYSTPIPIATTTTLRAIATKEGLGQSAVAVGVFTIAIASDTTKPPTFDPPGGDSYPNTQSVTLGSGTEGATICYTTNGSDPAACTDGQCGAGSGTYSAATSLLVGAEGDQIRARACKAGLKDSNVSPSGIYHFKAARAETDRPTQPATVAKGTEAALATVTQGATVRYTVDGEAPPTCVTGTPLFNGGATPPIVKNTVFHTLVCKPGYAPSDRRDFDFRVAAAPPTVTPDDGTKSDDITVTMTPSADADRVCYTLTDDGQPRCVAAAAACASGEVYTAPFSVRKNTTVRAVNCGGRTAPAHDMSAVVSRAFRFQVADVRVSSSAGPNDAIASFQQVSPDGTSLSVSLSSNYPGGTSGHQPTNAKVCYRTDGQAPTCTQTGPDAVACSAGSSVFIGYEGTIPAALVTPFVVKAVACAPDFANSTPRNVLFGDQASRPALTLTPAAGTYENDVTLQMQVAPADATICYRTGAQPMDDPTCSVTTGACGPNTLAYAGPMTIASHGTYVKAIACKVGLAQPSVIAEGAYDFAVATPSMTVADAYADGTRKVFEATPVTFASATNGATFHYEVGFPAPATPTCASPAVGPAYVFSTPGLGDARHVAVIACKPNYQPSAIVSTQTTGDGSPLVNAGLAPPAIGTPGGTFTNTLAVSVRSSSTTAPGARVCYATDGTIPTCAAGSNICDSDTPGSNVQGGVATGVNVPIVTNDFSLLHAITCANGFPPSNPEAVNGPPPSADYALVVSPVEHVPSDAASYAGPVQNVTLRLATAPSPTSAMTICYRRDGGTPAFSATTCAAANAQTTCVPGPAAALGTLNETTTIKYQGCKAGFTPTPVATAAYTIAAYTHAIQIDGVNDFLDVENAIPSTNGAYTSYVSWDAERIYVGLRGPDVNVSDEAGYVHVYLRAAGGAPSTNSPDSLGGGEFGTQTLPASFSHHVFWRTDDGHKGGRYWTGANWGNAPLLSSGVEVIRNGTFVELAIPRGSIATPQGLGGVTQLVLVGGLTRAGVTSAGFPGGGAPFSRYLSANMTSFTAPNAPGNVAVP